MLVAFALNYLAVLLGFLEREDQLVGRQLEWVLLVFTTIIRIVICARLGGSVAVRARFRTLFVHLYSPLLAASTALVMVFIFVRDISNNI